MFLVRREQFRIKARRMTRPRPHLQAHRPSLKHKRKRQKPQVVRAYSRVWSWTTMPRQMRRCQRRRRRDRIIEGRSTNRAERLRGSILTAQRRRTHRRALGLGRATPPTTITTVTTTTTATARRRTLAPGPRAGGGGESRAGVERLAPLLNVPLDPDTQPDIIIQHRDGGAGVVHELPPPYADRAGAPTPPPSNTR